jgi:hypothetical protein
LHARTWRPVFALEDWMAWANSDPPLAAEMRHCSPYRSVEGIDILRRRPDR